MNDITEEKNDFNHISIDGLDDLDTRGIIPSKGRDYDLLGMREYCKKKGVEPEDLTLDELDSFSIR